MTPELDIPGASRQRQVFRYSALAADGSRVADTIPAVSRDAAIDELHRRGVYPMDVRVAGTLSRARVRMPVRDLAVGMRMLANLLDAGLPMNKTLNAFEEMAPPSWAPGIPSIERAIRDGTPFATALAQSPLTIPPVIIGIIRAGEFGSGLALAVRRSAELLEQTAATRSAVRNALAYPMVLMAAGIASLFLLLGVVLPKFAGLIGDMGQAIPRTTRLVLAASEIVRALAVPSVIGMVILLVLWSVWTHTTSGKLRWHHVLLRLPWVGALRQDAATARTCAALASLLDSGVPIASALTHAAHAADDVAVESAIRVARDHIVHGESPSAAFAATNALSPLAVRLIRAGERSGRLAALCAHAATITQDMADQRVTRAVRMLEPAIIIVFGGMVALVAAALLQAMYAVRPAT